MSSNLPPDSNVGRLPVDLRPRRLILLPYNDLGINQGLDQFLPIDPKGFSLTLGMVYGLGPNEPRVLRTDDAGNLLVSSGLSLGTVVDVERWGGAGAQNDADSVDGLGQYGNNAGVIARGKIFNGGTWDRIRSSSAANLAGFTGLGSELNTLPGQWSVAATPAAAGQATASRAAGAAGVRHICTGFALSAGAAVAPAVTGVNFFIRDGATGAGTILLAFLLIFPAVVGNLIPPMTVTGLNLVGSVATAMTAEFSAGVASVTETANLYGYDAS